MSFRFIPFVMLFAAGCGGSGEGGSFYDPEEDFGTGNDIRYQVVVESVTFAPTKVDGSAWDGGDGRPDPCVMIGDEWTWYDMTPIAWDEYSANWGYATFVDFSVNELGSIGLTINDEDPPGEDDSDDDGERDDDNGDDSQHSFTVDLTPDSAQGSVFVINPEPYNGVDQITVRVQPSEWQAADDGC